MCKLLSYAEIASVYHAVLAELASGITERCETVAGSPAASCTFDSDILTVLAYGEGKGTYGCLTPDVQTAFIRRDRFRISRRLG